MWFHKFTWCKTAKCFFDIQRILASLAPPPLTLSDSPSSLWTFLCSNRFCFNECVTKRQHMFRLQILSESTFCFLRKGNQKNIGYFADTWVWILDPSAHGAWCTWGLPKVHFSRLYISFFVFFVGYTEALLIYGCHTVVVILLANLWLGRVNCSVQRYSWPG